MISLVIPAYNEEDRIAEVIDQAIHVMDEIGLEYEIIIVNDGSSDKTESEALRCSYNSDQLKVISYSSNKGKGYAIRTGFFSASGDSVVFMDGDLEINPAQIKRYLAALESGDVVIGSKRHPDSRVEVPLLRRFLSWGFNFMVKLLTGLKLSDTQSGLKAVKRKNLKKVFSILSIKRFAFDVELLAVANLYGLKIIEMPINIKLENRLFHPKEIFRMFMDLLWVTYRLRVDKYYLSSAVE